MLIAPRYKAVLAGFSEGIAFVKPCRGKIAIDENGRALFKIPYDGICPYKYGVAEYRRRVNTFSGKSFLGILAADAINSQRWKTLIIIIRLTMASKEDILIKKGISS